MIGKVKYSVTYDIFYLLYFCKVKTQTKYIFLKVNSFHDLIALILLMTELLGTCICTCHYYRSLTDIFFPGMNI